MLTRNICFLAFLLQIPQRLGLASKITGKQNLRGMVSPRLQALVQARLDFNPLGWGADPCIMGVLEMTTLNIAELLGRCYSHIFSSWCFSRHGSFALVFFLPRGRNTQSLGLKRWVLHAVLDQDSM